MVSLASSNHSKAGAGGREPLRCELHRYSGRCSGPGKKPMRARVEAKRSRREMWCGSKERKARDATRLCGRQDVLRHARGTGSLIVGMMKARTRGLDMRLFIRTKTNLSEWHRGKKKLRRSSKSPGENLQPSTCRSIDHQSAHTPGG